MTQQITAVWRRWHKGVEDLDGMDDIKLAKCYQVKPSRSRACRLHRSDWARATSCRMREKVGLMGPRNLQYWVALHPVRCSLRIVSGECLSCSSGCSHARLLLRSNWDPKSIEILFSLKVRTDSGIISRFAGWQGQVFKFKQADIGRHGQMGLWW